MSSEPWLDEQLQAAVDKRKPNDVIQAFNSLNGYGHMLFGRSMPHEWTKRPELRTAAAEALARLMELLDPATTSERTVTAIRKILETVDLPDNRWRDALVDKQREISARAVIQIRAELATLVAGRRFVELATMVGGLEGGHGMPAGYLVDADRATLVAIARPALDEAVSRMTWQEATAVTRAAGAKVVDLAPRFAALAEARDAARRDGGGEPREPALEAQIAAGFLAETPDEAALHVYADWLQARGHARGELIVRMLRGAGPGDDGAIRALIDEHLESLLGPIADAAFDHHAALGWSAGFLASARIAGNRPVGAVALALLVHPSGRFLRRLEIAGGADWPLEGTLADVIALVASDAPPTLREIHLGAGDVTDGLAERAIGDVSPLWALPNLRRLVVQGVDFDLGAIAAPRLEELELRTTGVSAEHVAAIVAARVPALVSLAVWFGVDDLDDIPADLDAARTLVERADLTSLRRLALVNTPFTDELCELLADPARSPLANTRLVELDLSRGTLGDAGARVLAAAIAARRWPALARLDVSDSFLTEDGIARLRASGVAEVIADGQRIDDGDRFPSVIE
jgi:hypothetical protein